METKTTPSASVAALWLEFTTKNPGFATREIPPAFYFCDNETDANECAELVVQGIKRATATSFWWFETHNAPLPKRGDLGIVTDWKGDARAIIETTRIVPTRYNEVSAEFAALEGEGDKTLEYWRRVHKAYFSREMEPYGEEFREDMIVLCEQFKCLFAR